MLTYPSNPRTLRAQNGFTLIEVLVAMVLLTVGILAALGALVSSSTLTVGSQVHEAAIGFAEQQIETLRQQPFASLGLTANPSPSIDPNDPNFYTHPATGSPPNCYEIQVNYQAGGNLINCETFVTGGSVPATPQIITGYQGLTGTYDAYITWHQESPPNNGCLTISSVQYCLSATGEKRITIAVLPTSKPGTGARKPIWLTTIITDPNTPPLALP